MTIDTELKPHDTIPKAEKPVLVCILDGWGENENKDKFNAIHSAETPVTDALKEVPGRWRTVRAHGTAVGLPSDADMGNSEVGHNALGTTIIVRLSLSFTLVTYVHILPEYKAGLARLDHQGCNSGNVHFIV